MSRDIFPRDKVTFRGWTTVDGVPVRVTLIVDTVHLIHTLGHKAAANRTKRAQVCHGDVVVIVEP